LNFVNAVVSGPGADDADDSNTLYDEDANGGFSVSWLNRGTCRQIAYRKQIASNLAAAKSLGLT
jgi:hypothetical protein